MGRSLRRSTRLAVAVALSAIVVASATGCAQIVDAINALSGRSTTTVVPTAGPSSSPSASLLYNSVFTSDGSVQLDTDLSDSLVLELNVWAQDPKKTQEWTPSNDKHFGFAVNVYDKRVDDKAVLAQKRSVYLSSITISSQTAQTSGQVQSPFQFSTDPRTMVPSDTLRSDKGLLLNTYQGGFLVPDTVIHQLPGDTYGLTLSFTMNVWVEGQANTDTSFGQQSVYEAVPIAIFQQ
ncbi:MAG: fructose 1,6-bisphosphatase [Microbacterium sp.]|jgi:hypothetical protein|uniref:Fructose 1,6-bisphosphatase n=2 Tax=Bacteria TaxID=2 RepID=A0A0F0M2T7_9MICO|nr:MULTISPECIES: hypothetical protein [Microbacterium]AHF25543.1 archaeal fructose-1,6-bisphosphatase [uncultured bacterium Contigcl_10-cl]MAL07764.1 fructose 1,6-bisphosphatase [Microbacterium sp.]MCK9913188.1 fructose 1,6-bisphosphatase [Microbacteriaceae bacterium K1510]KJL40447.1 hypothetical protein RR49_00403 [Microbacterium ginsengisoli]MBN9207835.1 fructose 1,6-bisphosphatase [Microbacterium ginsengisoli]